MNVCRFYKLCNITVQSNISYFFYWNISILLLKLCKFYVAYIYFSIFKINREIFKCSNDLACIKISEIICVHLVWTSFFLRFCLVVPPIDLRMRDDEFATSIAWPLIREGAKRVRFSAIFGSCCQGIDLSVKNLPKLRRAQYMRRHNSICFHPVDVGLEFALPHFTAVKLFRANRIHHAHFIVWMNNSRDFRCRFVAILRMKDVSRGTYTCCVRNSWLWPNLLSRQFCDSCHVTWVIRVMQIGCVSVSTSFMNESIWIFKYSIISEP